MNKQVLGESKLKRGLAAKVNEIWRSP